MSEAPERIWAGGTSWDEPWWDTETCDDGTEYVRADLFADLASKVTELEAAMDSKHAEVGSNIWRFWRDQTREYTQKIAALEAVNKMLADGITDAAFDAEEKARAVSADRIAALEAERDELIRDLASLKDAETAAVDEAERLRADLAKAVEAMEGTLWMAREWYRHGGDETTFADEYKDALQSAEATLASIKGDQSNG